MDDVSRDLGAGRTRLSGVDPVMALAPDIGAVVVAAANDGNGHRGDIGDVTAPPPWPPPRPDPLLIDMVRDVVGPYLAPPTWWCSACTRTADPSAGTVDLLAALDIATGEVMGKVTALRTAADFRDFLSDLNDHEFPKPAH
ncbi:hypothetical protein [Nonomuraea sp. NPDC050643]|uniref:hypothetical protein n=1 Tax=Nonomuraea sp. NPDC050643 TaxID=3155660 RepID=UPI0033FC4917